MRRLLFAAMFAALAVPADAHAMLEHANPGAGAVLSAAPKEVALDFSEALEPMFSTVTVADSAGHSVAAAASQATGRHMTVALKPLGPGEYRVTWRALSVDTHRTDGHYVFRIKP